MSSSVGYVTSDCTHRRSRWQRSLWGALGLCAALSAGCGDDGEGGASAAGGTSASGSGGGAASAGTSSGDAAGSGGAAAGSGGAGSGGAGSGAAGSGGAGSGGAGGAGGAGTGGAGGGGGDAMRSAGCGKARTLQSGAGAVQSGGKSRKYTLRIPDDYDNGHPYRLILSFHGATGNSGQVAPSYFGLWSLSEGSTIFIAPDAVGGIWSAGEDVTFVDDILKQVTDDLCIDTSRIELEGFSQGGAMAWTLACARPDVYRAAVVHSGGGLARPASCEPVAFMSSLGQQESGGAGQTSNSDFFAKQNGCTVEALAKAPRGGHACSDYKGCSSGHPTRWCDYDGGHTPSPNDAGQQMSWMPQEVWTFLSQF
ncbi:PHB depolymerase family esterase [Sorangium sp. So ce375]|uniref:alpha/beta hydrolase family esterase n=1 Tax=Sorangium sp. So ce375 TaxID=3133306 RepID=UPI003F5CADEE